MATSEFSDGKKFYNFKLIADADGNQVLGAQQDAVADLGQDISGTYTEAEVQAISDKVDAVLAVLRAHGLIAS